MPIGRESRGGDLPAASGIFSSLARDLDGLIHRRSARHTPALMVTYRVLMVIYYVPDRGERDISICHTARNPSPCDQHGPCAAVYDSTSCVAAGHVLLMYHGKSGLPTWPGSCPRACHLRRDPEELRCENAPFGRLRRCRPYQPLPGLGCTVHPKVSPSCLIYRLSHTRVFLRFGFREAGSTRERRCLRRNWRLSACARAHLKRLSSSMSLSSSLILASKDERSACAMLSSANLLSVKSWVGCIATARPSRPARLLTSVAHVEQQMRHCHIEKLGCSHEARLQTDRAAQTGQRG